MDPCDILHFRWFKLCTILILTFVYFFVVVKTHLVPGLDTPLRYLTFYVDILFYTNLIYVVKYLLEIYQIFQCIKLRRMLLNKSEVRCIRIKRLVIGRLFFMIKRYDQFILHQSNCKIRLLIINRQQDTKRLILLEFVY